jgi:Zn-dependent protease with chaperone function
MNFKLNRLPATLLSWPIALCLGTQVFAQSDTPTFPDPGKPHMSRDNQRSLGLQAAGEVYQQMPVLPDSSPETQYIRQLGQKLVATIPPENSWPFEFHVVAQKEINAFALPGGPMFVNLGAITAAANEAQLAGVMGHEMSHVYMQHSAKQAGKEETTSLLAGIAGAVLGGTSVGNMAGGLVGQLGQMGIQMGAQGLMMKYSRTDESQADAVGAVILHKAGYNPQALADFFKTLETEGGKLPPQFLSDHPNPGNREQAIEKEIANWPTQKYATDSPAFQAARQHAIGVKAYTAEEIAAGAKSGQWAKLNQQNGATFNPTGAANPTATTASNATAGNAPNPTAGGPRPRAHSTLASKGTLEQQSLPSQQMDAANLGPITIQHPDNWQVKMPEQQGQFVTIAPPSGITNNGVGYGVLLNGIAAQQGGRVNIDDVMSKLSQDMQQSDGLKPAGNAQAITIGNVQGRAAMFASTSPFPGANGQPQPERDWLVAVPQRDGSVVFMIFVAPEAEFSQFQPTFEAMLKSIQAN